MSDHYATLGISRSASLQEIKAAYRKLALQWHPDKNPENPKLAEEKFKEISHAFSVLGDENKRRAYDLGGTEQPRASHGYRDEEPFTFARASDIFRAFFGGRDPFADFFSGMPMGFGRGPFARMGSIFDDDDDFFTAPFGHMSSRGGRMGMGGGGGLLSMMGGFGGFGNFPALGAGNGFQAASYTSFSAGGPTAGAVHFEMRSTNNNGETKTYYKTVKQDATGRRIEVEGTDPTKLTEHIRQVSLDQPLSREEGRPALPARDSDLSTYSRTPSSMSRVGTEYDEDSLVYGRPRVAPGAAYNTAQEPQARDMDYSSAREQEYDARAYETPRAAPHYERPTSSRTITGTPRTTYPSASSNINASATSSRSRPVDRTSSGSSSYRRDLSPSLSKSGEHIVQGRPRYSTSSTASGYSSRASQPVTGRSRLSTTAFPSKY